MEISIKGIRTLLKSVFKRYAVQGYSAIEIILKTFNSKGVYSTNQLGMVSQKRAQSGYNEYSIHVLYFNLIFSLNKAFLRDILSRYFISKVVQTSMISIVQWYYAYASLSLVQMLQITPHNNHTKNICPYMINICDYSHC